MVEFALIMPLLVLLLVMAIDFGRVFFGWVALDDRGDPRQLMRFAGD